MDLRTKCRQISKHLRLGFLLLWDKRVPGSSKIFVMALGIAFTAYVLVFELPVEAFIAWRWPGPGIRGDLIFDGVEVIAVLCFFCCFSLPFEAPPEAVNQVCREHSIYE